MTHRKRLQVWLDETEYKFVQEYAKKNHMMVSELIRGWVHRIMQREGFVFTEPSDPEKTSRRSK